MNSIFRAIAITLAIAVAILIGMTPASAPAGVWNAVPNPGFEDGVGTDASFWSSSFIDQSAGGIVINIVQEERRSWLGIPIVPGTNGSLNGTNAAYASATLNAILAGQLPRIDFIFRVGLNPASIPYQRLELTLGIRHDITQGPGEVSATELYVELYNLGGLTYSFFAPLTPLGVSDTSFAVYRLIYIFPGAFLADEIRIIIRMEMLNQLNTANQYWSEVYIDDVRMVKANNNPPSALISSPLPTARYNPGESFNLNFVYNDPDSDPIRGYRVWIVNQSWAQNPKPPAPAFTEYDSGEVGIYIPVVPTSVSHGLVAPTKVAAYVIILNVTDGIDWMAPGSGSGILPDEYNLTWTEPGVATSFKVDRINATVKARVEAGATLWMNISIVHEYDGYTPASGFSYELNGTQYTNVRIHTYPLDGLRYFIHPLQGGWGITTESKNTTVELNPIPTTYGDSFYVILEDGSTPQLVTWDPTTLYLVVRVDKPVDIYLGNWGNVISNILVNSTPAPTAYNSTNQAVEVDAQFSTAIEIFFTSVPPPPSSGGSGGSGGGTGGGTTVPPTDPDTGTGDSAGDGAAGDDGDGGGDSTGDGGGALDSILTPPLLGGGFLEDFFETLAIQPIWAVMRPSLWDLGVALALTFTTFYLFLLFIADREEKRRRSGGG